MDLVTTQQKLEELLQNTPGILEAYHKAKTDFENLGAFQKPTLALYELAESVEGRRSQAEITRRALNHAEYRKYLESLNNARRAYNEKWARLKSHEIKLACLQSINKYLQ